jgi:FMN-dependent NADH-azoreductase
MTTLLHIRVSSKGEASHSRRIGGDLLGRLAADRPDLRVVVRDLGQAPPPHPTRPYVTASLMLDEARGAAEREALTYSEQLIAELEAAQLVVIDSPMHNFTVPSALKAWIDHVVRPRRTFRSTPTGKVGLLADRPVLAVVACGGSFAEGPAQQQDFFSPYLRYVLGSIGITSIDFLRLDNMTRGAEPVEKANAYAAEWIARTVERLRKTALKPG